MHLVFKYTFAVKREEVKEESTGSERAMQKF